MSLTYKLTDCLLQCNVFLRYYTSECSESIVGKKKHPKTIKWKTVLEQNAFSETDTIFKCCYLL